MFYCEPCRVKHGYPEGIGFSRGPCELCGRVATCYDVPSSYLARFPSPKEQPVSLESFSDADLEAELKRRKDKEKQPPPVLQNIDWTVLKNTVISCVDQAVKDQYWDEDNAHYIYEAAMEAVYGRGFFQNWYNKQKWKWVTG